VRALGLMSGTSLDGIDVADVDVAWTGDRLSAQLRHFVTMPIGEALRAVIVQTLPPNDGTTACVAELNVALGEAFASAALAAARAWSVDMSSIDVIGSHGQTLYHAPEDRATLQIGEPAVIAARTGVTCVADFRVADVAAGGQGAPLVPFVDYHLFASDAEHRVALNIGGIANLTLLPAGGGSESVRAFDSGPGNMVIDECVRLATNGQSQFDRDGIIAGRGRVHGALLDELLGDAFLAQAGPKSTGRERFGAAYALRVWERGRALGLSSEDVIATATALTARTAGSSVPSECARVIVSGGGARNRTLIDMFASFVRAGATRAQIDLSDAHGIPVDAKEAIAFAVLACCAIAGRANQLPACTGARTNAVLGKIVPGSNFSALMKGVWSA
jgi:anhydro-N-acetylmuramic acid kinase